MLFHVNLYNHTHCDSYIYLYIHIPAAHWFCLNPWLQQPLGSWQYINPPSQRLTGHFTTSKSNCWRQTSQTPWSWYTSDQRHSTLLAYRLPLLHHFVLSIYNYKSLFYDGMHVPLPCWSTRLIIMIDYMLNHHNYDTFILRWVSVRKVVTLVQALYAVFRFVFMWSPYSWCPVEIIHMHSTFCGDYPCLHKLYVSWLIMTSQCVMALLSMSIVI